MNFLKELSLQKKVFLGVAGLGLGYVTYKKIGPESRWGMIYNGGHKSECPANLGNSSHLDILMAVIVQNLNCKNTTIRLGSTCFGSWVSLQCGDCFQKVEDSV